MNILTGISIQLAKNKISKNIDILFEPKRVKSFKFIKVIIDEHINWNKYIELAKNKISKNTDIL